MNYLMCPDADGISCSVADLLLLSVARLLEKPGHPERRFAPIPENVDHRFSKISVAPWAGLDGPSLRPA